MSEELYARITKRLQKIAAVIVPIMAALGLNKAARAVVLGAIGLILMFIG